MKQYFRDFDRMDISIIIVNYNTPKLLEDCLRSIKSSKIKSKYEIVVVDNGSQKESVEIIKQLNRQKLIDKVILNKDNLGFSKANNKGVMVSRGKYKLLLNSDTIVKKDSIDELINFAENTKNCGVVGSRLLNIDGTIQPSCFNFPTIWRAIKQYWLKQGNELDKFAPSFSHPRGVTKIDIDNMSLTPEVREGIEVDAVVGASFLITPTAIKKVGLLDERYFMYFEDLDYCRSVWSVGLKVFYLPSSVVTHLHGQSGMGLKGEKDQWKRLIPSSKLYHGVIRHTIIGVILWIGQKTGQLSLKSRLHYF